MRKRLFETSDLSFNVYCNAPGQQNPLHRHPLSDEMLYFVGGEGECVAGLFPPPIQLPPQPLPVPWELSNRPK